MTTEILTRDSVTGAQSIKTLANIILTEMKSGNYTAEPNEVVQCSAGFSFDVSAPSSPEPGTLFGVATLGHTGAITVDAGGETFSDAYLDRPVLYFQGANTVIWKYSDQFLWVPVYSAYATDPLSNVSASFIAAFSGTGPIVILPYLTKEDSASVRWKIIADCHDTDAGNDDTAQFEILASFFRDESSVVTQRHVRHQVDDRDAGLQSPDVGIDFSIVGQTINMRLNGQVGVNFEWKIKVEVHEYVQIAA